jgi:hypothetical protein
VSQQNQKRPRQQWDHIFRDLRITGNQNSQPRFPHPAQLSFNTQGKMKIPKKTKTETLLPGDVPFREP